MLSQWNMGAHMLIGLALGALIGLERQWRARMAGLRTNALVAGGAALFVLLSKYGFQDLLKNKDAGYDGSRVAAQIVSGIGFLGAGVIMRDGLNVRGLNTAATLWCSAAVGSLCGAGLYGLAAFGTAGVVGANTVLRPLGRRVNRQASAHRVERPTAYQFKAVCGEDDEAHVRALLVQSLTAPGFKLRGVRSRDDPDRNRVTVKAELTAARRDDRMLEQAVSRLSLEPGVNSVSWEVIEEDDDEPEDDDEAEEERLSRREKMRNLFTWGDRS